MKKITPILSGLLCMTLLLSSGCQPANNDETNVLREDNQQSGVQGKNGTSLYRQQEANRDADLPERGIFRLAPHNDNQTPLGRTDQQGTRMGRDQVPYGYVEHSAQDPEVIQNGYGANIYIDRQVLAESVSQIVVGLQDVEFASVLVTDEDCIIGYQASPNHRGNTNGQSLDDMVQLAGLSVTPRWFKVYATSDQELIQQVQSITRMKAQHAEDQMSEHINRIIQSLGGPQESWEQDRLLRKNPTMTEQNQQNQGMQNQQNQMHQNKQNQGTQNQTQKNQNRNN